MTQTCTGVLYTYLKFVMSQKLCKMETLVVEIYENKVN